MAKMVVSWIPWTRALFLFPFPCRVPFPNKTHCNSPFSFSTTRDMMGDAAAEGVVSLQEWQGWGTTSPLPTMVSQIVEDMKVLEKDFDAQMKFGGTGGKLQVIMFMLNVDALPFVSNLIIKNNTV